MINTLSWIFIVLARWNNSPMVDISVHSDTLSWFQTNQSALLFNTLCLAEKQQIPILFYFVWPNSTIYHHTWGKHHNSYTTYVVSQQSRSWSKRFKEEKCEQITKSTEYSSHGHLLRWPKIITRHDWMMIILYSMDIPYTNLTNLL